MSAPTPRPTLGLCLIVKNEAQWLGSLLHGMQPFVDEMLVVDTGSTDDTVAIAAAAGARVLHHPWDGNYGRARNVYVDHATTSWILVLDGDESIAEVDRPSLRALMHAPEEVGGYTFTVRNYNQGVDLLSHWHGNTGDYPAEERRSECPGRSEFDVVRLFRRAPGIRYDERPSTHTNPIRAIRAQGRIIRHTDVVIHHFQWLKGGAAFVAAKQQARLADEIRHADAWPDESLPSLNVGRTLFSLERDDEALRYLERAIAADPDAAPPRLMRGLVLVEQQRIDEAIRDLRAAIDRAPGLADAHIVLGMAHHLAGRLAAAEAALREALRLRPDHPLAHNSLGVVLMDDGRAADAETHLRRALEILPAYPTAALNLVALYEQQGLRAEARQALDAALRLSPADPALLEQSAALGR